MVAVVSGSGLGLFGSTGNNGNPQIGRGNDRVFVNSTTGNLVIQSQDETLAALGLDLGLIRTYNSRGLMNDDNADNWRLSVHQKVYGVTGSLNANGSTVTKLFGDGREVVYNYDAAQLKYVSTEGEGAHDTLTNSSGTWTWQDGSGRNTETYNSSGQMTASKDADGNTVSYVYDPGTGNLTTITDASGQVTTLGYTGINLTSISVTSGGQPQTLTRYYYDSSNRLRQVVVDLTPAAAGVPLPDANGDGLYETTTNETYITTYTYDGTSKRVASITQSDGSSVSFTYQQQADSTWRVTSYSEAGQAVVTLQATQSALVTSTTTSTDTTYNLNPGVATPPGFSPTNSLFESVSANANQQVIEFDAQGNGFAAYVNSNASFNSVGLYLTRYTGSTGTWSTPELVSANGVAPRLSVDDQGNALLVWTSTSGVFARRYDAASGWGSIQQITYPLGGPLTSVDSFVADIQGDKGVVAWTTTIDPPATPAYRAFAATLSGGVWTTAQQVGVTTYRNTNVSAQVDAQGNATVLINSYNPSAGNLPNYIHYNRFTASTGTWGGPQQLDTSFANNQVQFSQIKLDFDANGNGIAIWKRGVWTGSNPQDLMVSRFNKAANTWSPITSLANIAVGAFQAMEGANLSVDALGNAMVVWESRGNGVGGTIYTRYYNVASGTWGAQTPMTANFFAAPGGEHLGLTNENGRFALLYGQSGTQQNWVAKWDSGAWQTAISAFSYSANSTPLGTVMGLHANGDVTALWDEYDQATGLRNVYSNYYSPQNRYTIPQGATWDSVALALYGNTAVVPKLQQQFTSIAPGTIWRNLQAITVTTVTTVPVNPPYYLVVNGDTWSIIAQKVYNSTDPAVSLELAKQFPGVTLSAGLHLAVPSSITALVTSGTARTTTITYTNGGPTQTTANANPAALSTTDTQTTTNTYNVNNGALSTTDTQTVTNTYNVNNAALSTTDTQPVTNTYNRNDAALSTTDTQPVTNTYGLNTGALSTTDTQTVTNNYALNSAPLTTQETTTNTVNRSLIPSALIADWVQTAGPQTFTTNANYSSDDPLVIKYDAAGNGFAVWREGSVVSSTHTGGTLFLKRFDVATGVWGTTTTLATSADAITCVDLAVDSAGNAIVGWFDTTDQANKVRLLAAGSSTWGAVQSYTNPVTSPSQTMIGTKYSMQVAIKGNRAVLGWHTAVGTGVNNRFYVARFDGTSWQSAEMIAQSPSDNIIMPSVGIDASGNITAVWGAINSSANNPMYARRRDAASGTWGSQVQIAAQSYPGVSSEGMRIRMEVGPNGDVVVVDQRESAVYNASTGLWLPSIVTGATNTSTGMQSLAMDALGNAVLVYYGVNPTFGKGAIYARVYDPASHTWGAATELTTSTGINRIALGAPRVAINNGQIVAGWIEDTGSGTPRNFRFSRYVGGTWMSSPGGVIPGTSHDTAQMHDILSVDPQGNVKLVWVFGVSIFASSFQTGYAYTIPSGATWQSIASAVYGDGSVEAGNALQTAMGNPALTAGNVLRNFPATLSVTTTTTVTVPPYYLVPSGASWQSVANTLYGVNSAAAGSALQAALGNPPLTTGAHLTGLPSTLSVTTTQTITVPAYYLVPSGASWQSVANTLYGVNNAAAGSALQSALGSPSIAAGAHLTSLPSTLSVTTNQTVTVPAYYLVPSGATWQSIANAVYGINSAAAGTALQSAMGNPSIAAGVHLTGLPATLSVTTNQTVTVPAYYLVPSGATWQSIANAVYGVNSAAAGSALQSAMGNPSIAAGVHLAGLPSTLSVTTTQTVTVPAYYLVPSGATWQSIANAVYGVNSAAAGSALQTAMGNPSIAAGTHLTNLPATLSVTTTTTITVPAYYLVPSGATWASIALAVYNVSDPNGGAALQAAMGNPALTAGTHLNVPATLTYTVTGSGSTLSQTTDVQDAAGRITTYTQDANGRLHSVLSPTVGGIRLEKRFDYDVDGNLITITEDPAGLNRVTSLGYDAKGNLLLSRDSLGNTLTRTYDNFNQLLTETKYVVPDPDGAGAAAAGTPLTTRFVYDGTTSTSESHLRFVITADGRVTEHRYNTAGQRTVTLNYVSALYTATNFAESDLTTWAAVTANKTLLERVEYAYDFRGNVLSITSFVSNNASTGAGTGTPTVTQFVYDQRGQLLQTLEARGSAGTPNASTPNIPYATTYLYDGLGRVLSTTRWDSASRLVTTLNAYDDANRVTKTTLANGLISTSTFDKSGQLITVSAGTGASTSNYGVTTYAYDLAGNLRIETDPTQVKRFFFYDAADRKIGQVDGDGTLTEFVYDRASEAIKSVVYSGRISAANLAALVDASGNPTNVDIATLRGQAGGDAATNRISRIVYDAAGRPVYNVDESGAVSQILYDGAGRVTDAIQFATRVTIPRSVDLLSPADFTTTGSPYLVATSVDDRRSRSFYDGDGHLAGTLDGGGFLVEYTYDNAGHVKQETRYANPSDPALAVTGTFAQLKTSVGTDTETAVDPERDITTNYFYDGQGRRVGVLDGERYLTETVYDVAGNVSQAIRYDKVLTYSASSTLASLRTAALAAPAATTHATTYQYDGFGRMVQSVDFEGTQLNAAYDSIGDVVSTTSATGTVDERTRQARYDALGRVVRELSGEGSRALVTLLTNNPGATSAQIDDIWDRYGIVYSYDLAGRKISATSKPNDQQTDVTRYFYDADGHLRFELNQLGERTEYRYDALNQLTDQIGYYNRIALSGLSGGVLDAASLAALTASADSTRDSRTSFTYALTGQVNSTTSAEGAVTTLTFNAFGEADTGVEQIDATHSLRHQFAYNTRGLLASTTWDAISGGLNTTETRDYDAFGRLTRVTDPRGNFSKTEYDRLGREIATVDLNNTRRTTTYDGFSRTLTTRDGLSNTTSYSYVDAARSTTVTTPEGISLTIVHTRNGQTLSVTAAGNTTTYGYDLDGNLTGSSDNLGALESRTYDRRGRLETQTNARGVVTRLSYDAANRIVTRAEDDAGLKLLTVYGFDGLGRVTDVTEPSGRLTHTSYDRDGRVTEVAIDPSGLNVRTSYAYNLRGDEITVTEGVGTAQPKRTQYIYDNLGRRTDEIVDPTSLGGTLNLRTQYRYDANGNLTRKIDANGNSTWYVYDKLNRLTHTINALGNVTLNSYDAENHVTAMRRYATALSAATLTTLATLDSPTTANFSVSTNTLDDLSRSFFDKNGREQYTIDAAGTVTERGFDAAGNVTRLRVLSTPALTGSYSNAAAVTTALGTAATTIAPEDRVQWTAYDLRGRATFTVDALGAVAQNTYDASDNVVATTTFATLRATTLGTDLASLQTWATANAGTAGNRTTRFWYDATDRRRFALDAEGYLTETRYADAAREVRDIVYAGKPTVAANATLADVTAAAALIVNSTDQTTTTTSDLAGRTSRITDSTGAYEEYTYDGLGHKLTYRNQKGAVWTYVYDAAGRLTDERSPVVSITTVTSSGTALSTSTETASLVTRMTYDGLGNVRTSTEGIRRYTNGTESTTGSRVTTYNYDVTGRQISTVNPQITVYSGSYTETTGTTTQSSATPTSTVTFDALGNATRNVDIGGGTSYRVYDNLGRLRYEIDALRYVTEHVYDVFGNEATITRFAQALGSVPTYSGNRIALSTMDTAVSALRSNTDNRTITKTYDRDNRVRSTVEPSVYTYEAGATAGTAGTSFTASPTTYFDYDAFGQVTREWKLVNPQGVAVTDPAVNANANAWATTHHFYDHRGLEVATVDALRYLTTHAYDETGDVTSTKEFAKALTSFDINATTAPSGVSTTPGTGTAPDSGYDREFMYLYDTLNRRTSETLLNYEYGYINGQITEIRVGQQQRSFTYDAVGNQTSVTQNGAKVYNYYDVLGRLVARAEPARDPGDGSTLIPLTEMKRDVFGNAVEEIRYGAGAASVNASSYSLAATSAALERHSFVLYDAMAHATQSQDARGALRNAAYNARGDLVKEWQTVTNRALTDLGNTPTTSVAETLVTLYQYDLLGQRTSTIEVQQTGATPVKVTSRATYNGFGEISGKSVDTGWTAEYFNYDTAGRVWRTNTGDGVDKVYLYNLAGQVTAEIRSRTLDLASASYTSAASVNALTGTMRTETRYDLLNRAVEQRSPQFDIQATQDLIDSQPQMAVVPTAVPPTAIYRQIVVGGATGYPGGWNQTVYVAAVSNYIDGGGYYQVTAPSASNPYGTYARVAQASYSVVQARQISWQQPAYDVVATFEYWLLSNPAAVSTLNVNAVAAGRVGVNVDALSGSYGYRISYTRVGASSAFAKQEGTFATATNAVVRGATTALQTQTVTPTTQQSLDRWGNVISLRDAAGGLTQYRYNQLNQLTYTLLPSVLIMDTRASVEQRVDRAQRSNYYDLDGRLFETRDGVGNTTRVSYNAAGQQLVQTDADDAAQSGGAKKRFVYDSFGNVVQITDELGYRTRNVYDKADNLVQVARESELNGFASAAVGDTSASNSANVLWEYYGYDESGRRTSATNGEGEVTKYWYDLRGNLIRARTPRNFDTTYLYDAFARKTRETDANATFSTWTYDAFGRLTAHAEMVNSSSISSFFTAGGAAHAYTYDEAGLMTLETTNLGKHRDLAYDSAGHLISITDNGIGATGSGLANVNRVTTYNYDAAGRKSREKEVVDGRVHQDSRIEYDGMSRIFSIDDPDYRLQYYYDANSNRTLIHATYFDHQMVPHTEDDYYRYDQMNRVTISSGVKTTGAVPDIAINASQGVLITYDAKGQRTSARTHGTRFEVREYRTNGVFDHITYNEFSPSDGLGTDYYKYDGLGRLTQLARETDYLIRETTTGDVIGGSWTSTPISVRTYDKAGRELTEVNSTVEGPNLVVRDTATVYDDDGRTTSETTRKGGQIESVVRFGDAGSTAPTRYNGYDAASVLRGYAVDVYNSGTLKYTTTYQNAYRLGEGYQDLGQSVSSSGTGPLPGNATTSRVYDANGDLVQFSDSGDVTRTRYFANNANGQALTAIKGQFDGASGRMTVNQAWDAAVNRSTANQPKAQYFFFVEGQNTGSFGQLQNPDGTFDANFDVNYTPVSSSYPASAPSQVVAQTGDTLRTVAARVFGDASLWYLIADENGLSDPSAAITEGTVLKIPNDVVSLSNTSSVFKPFNASDALGDTSPTQPAPPAPKPKKGGCGIIGMIIVIIVCIVVTVFTAGAAAAALAPALGSLGSAVVGGAIGAAVGSIASQGVGIAIGVQDKFSWSAVAKAAIGGAIGGALFGVTSFDGSAIKDVASTGLLNSGGAFSSGVSTFAGAFGKASGFVEGAANAAVSNVLTQGANMAFGLQDKFSWRDVAASAAGGAAGAGAGLAKNAITDKLGRFGGNLVSESFKNLASSTAQAVVAGGRIDMKSIAADAFGNALGNAIVGEFAHYKKVSDIADGLARRIGVDPNDPAARKLLRRVAEIQAGGKATTDELRNLTRGYLQLSGASQTDIDSTMAMYEKNLWRMDANNTREYKSEPAPAPDATATDDHALHLTITEGHGSAFGSARVDDLMIGAGEISGEVAEFIETKPALKYAMVALDIAAGPAAYVVRESILATPVGDMLSTAQAWALDELSGHFENSGYDTDRAGKGGGGALGIGEIILLGTMGAIKGIVKSGLTNRLRYVGRTPAKSSGVGLKVQDRMRAEGKLRDGATGPEFYSEVNKQWYPLKDADMSHKRAAVDYWNEEGRYTGAKSDAVKKFMNDETNYTLEHYSVNRGEGARMRVGYQPPATPEEIAEWLKRPR